MLRPLGLWLATLCCLAAPATALALDDDDDTSSLGANRSGGLVVTLTIDDEPYDALDPIPLGKRACDENLLLDFEITGFATGFSSQRYIEVWRGSTCNQGSSRNEANDDDACVRLTYVDRIENSTEQVVQVPMQDLCEEDGNITLYFLPVDSLDTNDSITPYGVYELEIDIRPPNAASGVDSSAGETEIPISWDPGDNNILKNWLVWDTSPLDEGDLDFDGGSDGLGFDGCGSGILIPGEDFDIDALPTGIRRKEISGNISSYDLDGTSLGARRVALGLISEDRAGNRSVMSNITCVTVVATDGFWDAYRGEGGEVEQGCTCSLPGTTSSGKLPLSLAPVALALVALRFRRKRRS